MTAADLNAVIDRVARRADTGRALGLTTVGVEVRDIDTLIAALRGTR